MPTIRKAHLDDAHNLAEVAEATFREAFASMNSVEQMELHCRSSYGEQIQAAEISNPHMITLLSETEGTLVGYAQIRWAKTPGCISAKSPGEIQRIYVAGEWHGKGIAQELMKACLAEIEQQGSDLVWLGVWERNPRAISFYRKFGFAEVGEHIFPLGSDPQRDIVMARPLGSEQ